MTTRRALLGRVASGSALLLGAGLSSAASKRRGPLLDIANRAQLSLAYRKLAYGLAGEVSWWWLRGVRYGVVDSVATPFWEMHIGTWLTTRDLPDDRYEVRMAGANFYTAPGSNDLLESFTNPYTGATLKVPYNAPRVSTSVHGPEGGSAFDGPTPPDTKITRSEGLGPAEIQGDEIIVRGDMQFISEPLDSAKRRFTVQDWSIYVGSHAEVSDPKVLNPAARQSFTDVLNFPAWLQMGDRPGSYVSRCYGRKELSFAKMPLVWREIFARKFPELTKDPVTFLRA